MSDKVEVFCCACGKPFWVERSLWEYTKGEGDWKCEPCQNNAEGFVAKWVWSSDKADLEAPGTIQELVEETRKSIDRLLPTEKVDE